MSDMNKTLALLKEDAKKHGEVSKYRVTEVHNGFVVSNLTTKADDVEAVKLFARNQRRHMNTIMCIKLGNKELARQYGATGRWVDIDAGVAAPHLMSGSV